MKLGKIIQLHLITEFWDNIFKIINKDKCRFGSPFNSVLNMKWHNLKRKLINRSGFKSQK